MGRIDIEAIEDEWEEDHHLLARRRRSDPLSEAAKRRRDAFDEGRVVAVDRAQVRVLYEGEVLAARFSGAMRGTKVVVGDRVRVHPPRHETDEARIVELLPRETVLMRTPDDTVDEERVVVANADAIAVVLAAENLEMGVRFLDRVLVAASVGGLAPIVVLNKIDLLEDLTPVEDVAELYASIGCEVRLTSALTGEGLAELEKLLVDSWTAFAGHSGVGKSRLFNRIVPEADHEVGEVGRYGGRHTTVAARAMRVPAYDAWLVDTPGVRSFGLGTLEPRDLQAHFPELADLPCELDDCLHESEPGCALPQADIHPDRLASYRRLLASLREGA